jgi:hypothetical protein
MAKRSRGSVRPGQRRPAQRTNRPGSRPQGPAPKPSTSLTETEEARAAELEAELVEQERAAERAAKRGRQRDRARVSDEPLPRGRARETGGLAARAANEYAYVARDIRRITVVAVALIAVLFVFYFLIDVAQIIRI